MRRASLGAKTTRRYQGITQRDATHGVAPNLLAPQFTAERPQESWLSDLSVSATREGWLYLAAILDVYSRRIIGWAMAAHLGSRLVAAALSMALRHHPAPGLIHHSERGSQYTAQAYQSLLTEHALRVSMSSTGN